MDGRVSPERFQTRRNWEMSVQPQPFAGTTRIFAAMRVSCRENSRFAAKIGPSLLAVLGPGNNVEYRRRKLGRSGFWAEASTAGGHLAGHGGPRQRRCIVISRGSV